MLKDEAYQLIKQRLFELDLVSGQFVTQKQISELIGIPLGPVREATLQLRSEGLVQIFPQRGIQISPVNEEMIRNLFGVRRLLEGPGIGELAISGDLSELRALQRKTAETLRNAQRGQIERLSGETFRVDQRLHEMAIGALNNRVIADFYKVQQDRLRLVRLNIRSPNDQEPGLSDHLAILDALCDRDSKRAQELLITHLNGVESRALRALSRMPTGTSTPGMTERSEIAARLLAPMESRILS